MSRSHGKRTSFYLREEDEYALMKSALILESTGWRIRSGGEINNSAVIRYLAEGVKEGSIIVLDKKAQQMLEDMARIAGDDRLLRVDGSVDLPRTVLDLIKTAHEFSQK